MCLTEGPKGLALRNILQRKPMNTRSLCFSFQCEKQHRSKRCSHDECSSLIRSAYCVWIASRGAIFVWRLLQHKMTHIHESNQSAYITTEPSVLWAARIEGGGRPSSPLRCLRGSVSGVVSGGGKLEQQLLCQVQSSIDVHRRQHRPYGVITLLWSFSAGSITWCRTILKLVLHCVKLSPLKIWRQHGLK